MRIITSAMTWNTHHFKLLNHFFLNARFGEIVMIMQLQRFGNLRANCQGRIKRRHGVLKDHGNFIPADSPHSGFVQLEQILALKQNLAGTNLTGPFG